MSARLIDLISISEAQELLIKNPKAFLLLSFFVLRSLKSNGCLDLSSAGQLFYRSLLNELGKKPILTESQFDAALQYLTHHKYIHIEPAFKPGYSYIRVLKRLGGDQ